MTKRAAKRLVGHVYPEHDKLHKVKDKSQAIGEFLDWLSSQELLIATYVETRRGYDDMLVPSGLSINTLLERHFEIDGTKLEAEKRHMLESLRKNDKTKL